MKRPKKSQVTVKKYEAESYEVQCPYCGTYLQGGYNRNILRMNCHRCKNPIDLIWD